LGGLWWQAEDRRVLKRINQLIQDVIRDGHEGIGKPNRSSTTLPATGFDGSPMNIDSSTRSPKGDVRIAACRYHFGR
jgi:toxin YoeB